MASKPRCQYWAKCYRKAPAHLAAFAHPGDADDTTAAAAPVKKPAAAAAAAKPTLTKPKAATMAATAAAAAEAAGGKKRPRDHDDMEEDGQAPAAAAAAAAPAAAAAAVSADSADADSAADKQFLLEDVNVDEKTAELWDSFHQSCFATSCPAHPSPSPAASFFTKGQTLLRGLYGMEFGADLMHLFQFAVQQHHKRSGRKCCDVQLTASADAAAASAADAAPAAAAAATATAAATEASGTDGAAASADVSMAEAASSSGAASPVCSWKTCCASIRDVFVPLLGLQLAGPLRILCGDFGAKSPRAVHPFLLDRYFYDSPEVWTFLAPAAADAAATVPHLAVYRDDPRPEFPASFVGALTADSPVVTPVGPTTLAALMFAIDRAMDEAGEGSGAGKLKKQKTISSAFAAAADGAADAPPALTLEQLRADLDAYGKAHGFTLTAKGGKRPPAKRDSAWLKRDKKVVCDLDNGVGLVVPYEDDIGWRPVNCENEQLTKIVKDIESAKYSGRKINFDALDHLVTLTAYANDERDPGMGIELALNLFAKAQTNAINSDVCRLLSLGYQLVDRDLYSRVVEEFMRHRGAKGQRPSFDWV